MVIYFLAAGCALLAGLSAASWYRGRATPAVLLLMGAALLLRLLMASLDPFLHDWDERFHAAVAHNMVAQPWRPALRPVPWLPYDYRAWASNFIWLHKQPLFLWQMALSLKLFGVNTLALRLPSVMLSTLLLWPVYRVFGPLTGYLGAVLVAFAYYQLEMVSGALGMDHNDVAFLVYVTASIWAYYEYRTARAAAGWLVLTGLLAGAAVLCKWLPGLLVYTGWGLDLLLRRPQRPLPALGQLLAALVITGAMVLPWQLYLAGHFPQEYAYEQAYNVRHFTEVLEGHSEPWYFHVRLGPIHYGLLVFAILGGAGLALRRRAAWPLLAMSGLVYGFFTLAATKMYSYTYMVSPLLLLLAALAVAQVSEYATRHLAAGAWPQHLLAGVGLLLLIIIDLRPWGIMKFHRLEQSYGVLTGPLNREARLAHADAYRRLAQQVPAATVVFNVPAGDEQAALFFSSRSAYASLPTEADVRRLRAQGAGVAVYPAAGGQALPAYLRAPGIQQLPALPAGWE